MNYITQPHHITSHGLTINQIAQSHHITGVFCFPGAALHPVAEVACVLLWCGVGGLVVRWFDSIGGGGGCKKQKENQHPDGDKNCIGINLQKVFSHLNLFPLARRCTSIGICSVNVIFARRDVVEALLPLPFQTGASVQRTDFSTTLRWRQATARCIDLGPCWDLSPPRLCIQKVSLL